MTNIINAIINAVNAINASSIETYVGGTGKECRRYQASFFVDNKHYEAEIVNKIGEQKSAVYVFAGPEPEYIVIDASYTVTAFDIETLRTKVVEYFGEKAGIKSLNLLEMTEQNPFADERTCHNGGGYFQPYFRWGFEFEGRKYVLVDDDYSCGDFGERRFIGLTNSEGTELVGDYYINQMDYSSNDEEYYGIDTFNHEMPLVKVLEESGLLKF